VLRTDEYRISYCIGDEIDPSLHESPEQHVSDVGRALHNLSKCFTIYFKDFPGIENTARDETSSPRKLRQLSRKLARRELTQHRLLPVRYSDELDTAAQHDKDSVSLCLTVEQDLISDGSPYDPALPQFGKMRLIEARK
jgi:hypothetical protein